MAGADAATQRRRPKAPKAPRAAPAAAGSVAAHPRAAYSVNRAKGLGGLLGLLLVGWLSLRAGTPPADAAVRALGAGVLGYVVAWALAVQVWRQLVVAEMRAHAERRDREAA